MADYAISNVPRRVVYAPSGVGPYAFTFEILNQTDIAVYKGSTLLALTSQYTVTINANGTGSVTLVSSAGSENITIVGARAIQRSSDYTTGGDLFASTLNTDLDSQTIYSQQVAETAERSLKNPVTDSTSLNMNLPTATVRANKVLGFTSTGEPTQSNSTIAQIDSSVTALETLAAASANSSGSIAHIGSGAGMVATTVQSKLREIVSIKDFGAVGDGVTNDTAAVQAAEASSFTYIDLVGLTVLTTLDESQISKNYFNGILLYEESNDSVQKTKPVSPFLDAEIQRPRTKSPRVDWKDKRVLWLGTSIPHFGGSVDGYPILFGKALGCTVDNLSWSGSSITYDYLDDPFEIGTVKALSMTEDDRQWGLTTYGSSSAYDDSFDAVTKASQMTCDTRIRDQFALRPYDCIMLDHNHNDRIAQQGVLNPTKVNITGITIGATTTITSANHGLGVGDAVALEVTGISFLNYAAARVQSVTTDTFTLNIDSSAYTGSFTSGQFVKLDRATLFGSFNFTIYYIKNCIIRFGNSDCNIVLSGAPNEYTAGRTKPYEVYSNAESIKQLASKWSLSFFDVGYLYDIKPHDKNVYFPDGYHPSTLPTRQALANHWVTWAQGGEPKTVDETDFLPTGSVKTFTDQREAIYSKYLNGFGTPTFTVSGSTNLVTDSFASLAGWTTAGTTPTAGAAPWGSGNSVNFDVATATTSTIAKNVTFTNGTSVEFDVYVPVVTGLTTGLPKTIGILAQRIPVVGSVGGSILGSQIVVRATGASIRGFVFNASGSINYFGSTAIAAATKYTIKFEAVQGTTTYTGAYLMYINGTYVGGVFGLDFSTYLTLPQSIMLGIVSNNLGAFEMDIGNLVVDSLTVNDFTNRYTGTFTSADSKTVTVVNGIIVSAV